MNIINVLKMKNYKKIVAIPTGVVTKIKDTLEGTIKVEFKVRPEFDNPICYKATVLRLPKLEEGESRGMVSTIIIEAPNEEEAMEKLIAENEFYQFININILR